MTGKGEGVGVGVGVSWGWDKWGGSEKYCTTTTVSQKGLTHCAIKK